VHPQSGEVTMTGTNVFFFVLQLLNHLLDTFHPARCRRD